MLNVTTMPRLFETPRQVDRSTRAREVRPTPSALPAMRARVAQPGAVAVRPQPKCFCQVKVANCPTCTKVNWNNVRPSNGNAQRDRVVAARIEVRNER